jgi:hypothetical protein
MQLVINTGAVGKKLTHRLRSKDDSNKNNKELCCVVFVK